MLNSPSMTTQSICNQLSTMVDIIAISKMCDIDLNTIAQHSVDDRSFYRNFAVELKSTFQNYASTISNDEHNDSARRDNYNVTYVDHNDSIYDDNDFIYDDENMYINRRRQQYYNNHYPQYRDFRSKSYVDSILHTTSSESECEQHPSTITRTIKITSSTTKPLISNVNRMCTPSSSSDVNV